MVQLERTAHSTAAMPTSTPAKLRQIAILLHSLPSRTHGVLLGQLSSSDQQRVQAELDQLGDVDPMEQYRTMKQMREHLTRETQSIAEVESEIHDEIQIGRARVSKTRKPTLYHNPDTSFQTSVAPNNGGPNNAGPNNAGPDNAGPNATAPNSTTTTNAIPSAADELNRTPPGSIPFSRVQPDADSAHQAEPSPVAIHSIDAYRQPCELDSMQVLIEQYQQTQAAGILNSNFANAIHGGPAAAASDSASQTVAATPPLGSTNPASGAADNRDQRVPLNTEQLAQRIDQFLINLPPEDLCYALGMGTTKQAFLVLCGLPNEVAESTLKRLPRKQAKQVRSAMRSMNQLQISEIDQAKRAIAEIAIRIAIGHKALAA